MKIKKEKLDNFYIYTLSFLLMLSIALKSGSKLFFSDKFEEPELNINDIQQLFPNGTSYQTKSDGSINVLNNKNNFEGIILPSYKFSRISGYGGYVPVLWGVDSLLKIQGAYLLPNDETPEFLDHLKEIKFYEKFKGASLKDISKLDVDVVSGATETSNAVIKDLNKIASDYAYGQVASSQVSIKQIIHISLFLMLLVFSLAATYFKVLKKYRIIYLVFVVLVMGILTNKMLSLELFQRILINGLPWQSNWEVVLLLLIALLMPWLKQRRFFCLYLCPMGAIQELFAKLIPVRKRSLNKIKWNDITLSNVYLTAIWVALLVGLNPELSLFEPFMVFSFKVVGWGVIVFGVIVLIMSMFFNRPWCSVCPTGCLLKTLEPVKSNKK